MEDYKSVADIVKKDKMKVDNFTDNLKKIEYNERITTFIIAFLKRVYKIKEEDLLKLAKEELLTETEKITNASAIEEIQKLIPDVLNQSPPDINQGLVDSCEGPVDVWDTDEEDELDIKPEIKISSSMIDPQRSLKGSKNKN